MDFLFADQKLLFVPAATFYPGIVKCRAELLLKFFIGFSKTVRLRCSEQELEHSFCGDRVRWVAVNVILCTTVVITISSVILSLQLVSSSIRQGFGLALVVSITVAFMLLYLFIFYCMPFRSSFWHSSN